MGRSQVWDGTDWVSMTGGAGDGGGGGEPDDTYLRLDGANNPASPNNFLRGTDLDGYLPLTGGTLTGPLIIDFTGTNQIYFRRSDTADEWYVGLNSASGLYFRLNGAAWMGLTPAGMDMNSHRIYGLADAGGDTDALARGYADARYLRLDDINNPAPPNNFLRGTDLDGYLPLSGGTMTGKLVIYYNGTDALYFQRSDTPESWYLGMNVAGGLYFRLDGIARMGLTGSGMDMNSYRIYGLADAGSSTDAVSRGYADARYLNLSGGTLTGDLNTQKITVLAGYGGIEFGDATEGLRWINALTELRATTLDAGIWATNTQTGANILQAFESSFLAKGISARETANVPNVYVSASGGLYKSTSTLVTVEQLEALAARVATLEGGP